MFLEEFFKGGGAFSILRATTDEVGVSDYISHGFFLIKNSICEKRDLKINTGDILDSWEISFLDVGQAQTHSLLPQ